MKSIFVKLRKLFEKPESWTRYVIARNSSGNRVPANSGEAVCWCFVGGLYRIGPTPQMRKVVRDQLPSEYFTFAEWNDDPKTTHNDVLALIDRCIDAAGAR